MKSEAFSWWLESEPLSLLLESRQWLESVGHFTPSDEAKSASLSGVPMSKDSKRATFAFVHICYNSKIEEGRYMPKGSGKVIAQNKKAFHDYFIEETYEAGLVLQGTEIKSIRAGRVNLKDAFARVHNGEVWVHNMHISTYEQGNRFNHDPLRTRKLLLHKKKLRS